MELITYNAAIQTWSGGYRSGRPRGKTIADVQKVLHTLAEAAYAQDMTVSQKEVRYGMVEQDRYPVVMGTAQYREKAQKA